MNCSTAWPSPLRSTSDLLPPSEACAARRKPRIRLLGFLHVGGAIGLLLGPARARDEQQLGVRADGLLVGLGAPGCP